MIYFPRDILCIFWWWTIIAWYNKIQEKLTLCSGRRRSIFGLQRLVRLMRLCNLGMWFGELLFALMIDSKFHLIIPQFVVFHTEKLTWTIFDDTIIQMSSLLQLLSVFLMTIFCLRLISTQQISEMNSDIVIMITFTKIGGKTLFGKLNWVSFPWQ